MVAITTLNIKSKFNQIKKDFSGYGFEIGNNFYWDSSAKKIFTLPIESLEDLFLLLHEIAHAELGHEDFNTDIDLLRIEANAWQYAQTVLAKAYGLNISDVVIQDSLDSYRLWLHKRSLCPDCAQNGIQTNQNAYSCINCRRVWRVNNALFCRLRRVRLQVRSQL